ncbi:MAG: hypothetical protein KBG11_10295 [Bacteroidia bacterium]|jgi:hypothetical protein|nr:hypothetical protein [Bacteroidia bacterium]
MPTITLELNEELLTQINTDAQAQSMATNEWIIDVLEKRFYLNKLAQMQVQLQQLAAKKGFKTEEDIYVAVS